MQVAGSQPTRFAMAEMKLPQVKRTVLCHGSFDLLHLGHIRHLQEARKQGDRLIVSVTPDEHVRKGVRRPRFTAQERVEALKALDCVDDAFIAEGPDAVASIQKWRPAVYCKGIDYAAAVRDDPTLDREIEAVLEAGGRFHTTTTEKWSSSRLLNAAKFPDEVLRYLDSARDRGFLDKIKEAFGRADELNLAFVGENIFDQYEYVRPLGMPSKEFILAVEQDSMETFPGGVYAAAAHADWRSAIVVTAGAPLCKTRYVDGAFNRKLFEVYSHSKVDLTESRRAEFRDDLSEAVEHCDAVLVFDFGHGLIDGLCRATLEKSKFLAVNTQTNAGNRGFNLIGKYRPHLACLDVPEARLATGMQDDPLEEVGEALQRLLLSNRIPLVVVTHGRDGCYVPEHIPAFSTDLVDTMGAGDAFLAVTAPLVAVGLELEAAAFAGNVAGAVKVSIMGHRRHVSRNELMQNIEALLA